MAFIHFDTLVWADLLTLALSPSQPRRSPAPRAPGTDPEEPAGALPSRPVRGQRVGGLPVPGRHAHLPRQRAALRPEGGQICKRKSTLLQSDHHISLFSLH